ncbi:unnamed protein product [Brassica rapa]|uniref:RING-type domain-containing protein n=1 Tax=Brassica campestris TaxID=3711 RepID=A0A8D9HAX8_BRACM|nr:unnamed protein product [Brassica rapa]
MFILRRRAGGGGGGDRRCFSCSPCIAEVPSRGEPTLQSQDNQKDKNSKPVLPYTSRKKTKKERNLCDKKRCVFMFYVLDATRSQRDGSVDIIGSQKAPPFPIPHILLKDIGSFDPHNINPLLQLDPVLCKHISVIIDSKAAEERVPGPLYISLYVTVTPHRFLGDDIPFPEQDEEMETCGICLEELNPRGEIYFDMPNCSHQFHDLCISRWLRRSKTCPLCRTFADYDD